MCYHTRVVNRQRRLRLDEFAALHAVPRRAVPEGGDPEEGCPSTTHGPLAKGKKSRRRLCDPHQAPPQLGIALAVADGRPKNE